ncbi:hypothetical protein GCM10027612_01980 [Microbispora bryophytorum subsp. camponoti]
MLMQQMDDAALAAAAFDDASLADEGAPAVGQVRGNRQPSLLRGVSQGSQAGAVLVVATGELHVVQDDPGVRREEFGQGAQPGEEVRLVDGASSGRR